MYPDILKFWFEEIKPSQWWVKDTLFDKLMVDRFMEIHKSATQCELFPWRESPEGRLAEVIVLDQFSRNMFRGLPQSFDFDSMALVLAQEAILNEADKKLTVTERNFLYMPFMHSESLKIHDTAVELFQANGIQGSLEFEIKHKNIIEKFGRYPHRNNILDRESSDEELAFLKQPGSGF